MSNFIRNLGSLAGLSSSPAAAAPASRPGATRDHVQLASEQQPPPSPPSTSSQVTPNRHPSFEASSSDESLDLLGTPERPVDRNYSKQPHELEKVSANQGNAEMMQRLMQTVGAIKASTENLEKTLTTLAVLMQATQGKVDEVSLEVKALRVELFSRNSNLGTIPDTSAVALSASIARLDRLPDTIARLVSDGISQGLRAYHAGSSGTAAAGSATAPVTGAISTADVLGDIDMGGDIDQPGLEEEQSHPAQPDPMADLDSLTAPLRKMPSKTMQKRQERRRAAMEKEQELQEEDQDGRPGYLQADLENASTSSSSAQPHDQPADLQPAHVGAEGIDVVVEVEEADEGEVQDSLVTRRRSGRQSKAPSRLIQESEALVKARKRSNGGYKHRAFPRRKTSERAKPASFYEKLAKMNARLRVSDGIKRGKGVWPDKAPNTQRGLLQEIVCDACKGRVHWSCAGLRIEDDPIDEWLCPDCVERLDSGAHRDDIEQAPLDRCIRGTCILRQKQAIIKMEDDEMQYQVEKIVGRRAIARDANHARIFEYLVKWVGWEMSDSTWEPRTNFAGDSIIDTFVQEATVLGVRLKNKVALLPEAAKDFDPDTGKLYGEPDTTDEEDTGVEDGAAIQQEQMGVDGGKKMDTPDAGRREVSDATWTSSALRSDTTVSKP